MEWFLDAFKYKYADFSGRARRNEYWMFMLFHVLIIFLLAFLSSTMVDFGWANIGAFGLIIYFLMSFIPALAMTIRRLHDTGKSGWFYLLACIPYVGGIILLIFTIQDSESTPNKWGPNPKSSNTDEINQIGRQLDEFNN